MGLRAQSLAGVLAFTLGVGGVGVALLDHFLTGSFERIEQKAMRADFHRLVATLDEAVQQRARGAREWSQWSDMRDYALQRNLEFETKQLSPGSVATSGLVFLAVLNPQGELLRAVAAEPGRSDLAVAAQVMDVAQAAGREVRRMPQQRGRCALSLVPPLGPDWMVLCHLPIRDSAGEGAPSGILVTAERLSADQMKAMGEQAALHFSLQPWQADEATGWQDLEGLTTPWGESRLWWQPGDLQHRLRIQLHDLGGAPVAWLALHWPRELRLQGEDVLRGARWLFIVLALLLAMGAYWVVDLRLVRRLRALRRQMAAAREQQDWTPRLRVRGHDEIRELADEGNHLLSRIRAQMQALEEHALTDPLTGLYNRRAFLPRLEEALARSARSGQPLMLALVDADHFKRFNDSHGHAAGDRALAVLADGLRAVARRAGDMAARIGGEEFALLFEGDPSDHAQLQMAKLQQWLAAQPHGGDAPLAQPLTVSVGMAAPLAGEGTLQWLERADAALYQAKANGRNRVEIAAPA